MLIRFHITKYSFNKKLLEGLACFVFLDKHQANIVLIICMFAAFSTAFAFFPELQQC